ncbi:GDP-D-glucose phosphorylase 1-like isoform X1 [Ruditapes philippinarum]|uniref:GDP-D-glucose phosphorylase 1-like isoform X1 n=1 Tax=Ruditapes philippinarum TaxID=129788 RepID=UPI00295A72E4|nr:GDP-D-glucose phosphorylase 1-like isoform X1 [Ruditapes philippinarum]
MAQFTYTESDFNENTCNWQQTECQQSKFDETLQSGWDKAVEDGHFRYKLDIEETRVIGSKKYIAQLNVKRAQERRKPDVIESVNQPFNPASFNFLKIKPPEILLELVKEDDSRPNNQINQAQQNGTDKQAVKKRNLVVINVSPLEYGHVLLVPDIDACQPQVLTESSMRVSLEMMLLSKHRGFRIGFNSLCAFASVNHAHLHAYYLDRELFVESVPVKHICGDLYELDAMPAKGFAFQLHKTGVDKLSKIIFHIADYFQKHEVAHNMYMIRGPVFNEDQHSTNRTIRVYLWPRKKFIGSMWLKDEEAFNVALVELAGHLPVKVKEMFYDLDEEKIESTIRDAALEDREYNSIKQDVSNICQSFIS